MMTTKTDTSMLKMERTLKAPVEKVFKAWTEPEQMIKWFGCAGNCGVNVTQDLRVGGDFSITMQIENGKSVTASGKFIEIDRNRKLVYSWNNNSEEYPAKDTLVTVEFIDKGNTTELVLEHSKFDKPVIVQGHTMGWGAALDKFEAIFA
jgi:uncharacterized protein YndB with AHSA1/START domain